MLGLWVVIANFLGLQVLRSSASGCQHGDIEHSVKVTSGVYRVDGGITLYRCIAHCQMARTCQSINYHTKSKSCGLLDTNGPSLSTEEHYIFVSKKTFQKSLAGSCTKLNCGSGKKCIVDRLHRASCVADSSKAPQPTATPLQAVTAGCGHPQQLDNASVSATGHDVGDVAFYDCNPGLMMCGAHTVECQATGTWSTSDFRCQSDYVPVVEWMASCLLTRGSSVVLTEIKRAMAILTIEIQSEDTIDNDLRLEIDLPQKLAIWSQRGGGTWTQVDMYSYPEDVITLNMTLTVDRIEVRINGMLYPDEVVGTFEEAYRIDISSARDTDAIRVRNCCL